MPQRPLPPSPQATILIKSSDWEQAAEIAQRVLTKNPSNMEALMLTILYLQVRECRPSVTDSNLNDLVKAIEAHEPRNAELCYRVARTVARLSGNNTTALQKTHALVEKAHKLEPTRSDYLTELGYQYGLLGDDETALKSFKEASQVDEGNVQALIGVIKCQVMMGKLDDAEQQLEFLNEIQASMGKRCARRRSRAWAGRRARVSARACGWTGMTWLNPRCSGPRAPVADGLWLCVACVSVWSWSALQFALQDLKIALANTPSVHPLFCIVLYCILHEWVCVCLCLCLSPCLCPVSVHYREGANAEGEKWMWTHLEALPRTKSCLRS